MSNGSDLISWMDGPAPGVKAGGDDPREFVFDRVIWDAAPQRLQGDAASAYQKLGGSGAFGPWWSMKCGGETPIVRRFRLRMPPSEWDRPWEGIISALDRALWPYVSIVRQTEDDTDPHHATELDAPMQVLCLHGAETGPNLGVLDLDAEFNALLSAYKGLDLAACGSIAEPRVAKVDQANLKSLLIEHRPSILWYSGHARADPPGLLLNDGHWLTPDEFAATLQEIVDEQGRTPLYVVLWACKTGNAERFSVPAAAPPFIDALARKGISGLLASQAPLSDKAARRTAGRIFSALAAGHPLDHGVASARGELMRYAGDKLLQDVDWLCPVVWCKGALPEKVTWADRREQVVRRQDAGRKLLPTELAGYAYMLQFDSDPPSPWESARRLWIISGAAEGIAARGPWIQRVVALQKETEKTVLCFIFSSSLPKSLSGVLKDWSKLVGNKLEHDDDPDKMIRLAAEEIQEDQERGWMSICSNERFILGLIDPPEDAPEWFWAGPRQNQGAQVIVLGGSFPEERGTEDWRVDSLTALGAGLPATNLDVLAALAVLRQPADRDDIQAALAGASAVENIDSSATRDFEEWIHSALVLETDAGCVVPAGAAERVIAGLDHDARIRAHRLAYVFLNGPNARRKLIESPREEFLSARWHHARQSGWIEAIRDDGTLLLKLYYAQRRSSAFLNVFEVVKEQLEALPSEVVIHAAWSILDNRGKPDDARSWLSVRNPDAIEAISAAYWYSTSAEVWKASGTAGSKQAAFDDLQKGLETIDEEISDLKKLLRDKPDDEKSAAKLNTAKRRRLSIRHDIARLVHFFKRQPAQAAAMFAEILTEWKGVPFSEMNRAITSRNLAEALMDSDRLDEAEVRIDQSRKLLPNWTFHPVCSEREYLSGRLATRRKLDMEVIRHRFQVCLDKALKTNHLLMVAIAEARIFWLADGGQAAANNFDHEQWTSVAHGLFSVQRHAWAARVLIKGRLRSARRISAQGYRGAARKELMAAHELLKVNPGFDDGDDLQRIVATYAGLALLDTGTAWWTALKREYPWSQEWVDTHKVDDPNLAWELAG
jgi:hypothetical protein